MDVFVFFHPAASSFRETVFFISRIHQGKISIYNVLSNKVQPPPNPAIMSASTHTYTHTSELHLQQVVIVFRGGWGKESKGKKVSRLSITELSECYLCQTPTILSSDTETASRTSGRRGKHSRTPREVWQRHWIQQAQNTEHTCEHTHTHIQYTHGHTMDTQMHAHIHTAKGDTKTSTDTIWYCKTITPTQNRR